MSENTLTHKALAEMLQVSETTVKSYRRKFPGCIPVANQGKPIRFKPEAAKVALRIRDLFELGMSVEEVRARLSEEFDWISPEEARQEKHPASADKGDPAPELTQGVSNMAKSMVAMAQQQKAILSRMQGIEAMLEELGLQGSPEAENKRTTAAEQARQKEELLNARLNNLDATTQELAVNMASLADNLNRFLSRREQAAEEWRSSGGLQNALKQAGHDDASRQQDEAGSKVIPMRQTMSKPADTPAEQVRQDSRPIEPPRNFLTLPLVVRTGQGQYVSAGGRGRFCVNDLKAMLAYGFTPPHHFVMKWEAYGQGWRLFLEQAAAGEGETPKSYELLLMELSSQKGTSVVEILQFKDHGEALHPAEVCGVISSFSADR